MGPVTRDAQVGFAGLGNLGEPMARALLSDGWALTVLDPRPGPADTLAAGGARKAEAPRDLAGCDVVALVVPDDAAVDAVLVESGLLEALAPGGLVVVHSTILPASARRLAATAAERGIGLLDAPVSGGADRALAGDLTVMVGGEADVVERARPLLDAVGSEVRHVGPSGAGSATKLANQLMLFSALAGVHEALDLARAYDVEESAVLGAVASGTGASWAASHWGFFDETARAYDAGGTPVRERPWSKDLWEVVAAARAADVELPVAGLLAQVLARRVEAHAREG